MNYADAELYMLSFEDLEYDNDHNVWESKIVYDGKQNEKQKQLFIKTSPMKIERVNETVNTIDMYVSFLLNHPSFYEFVRDVDTYVIDTVFRNGSDFFGSMPNYETVSTLYKKSINLPSKLSFTPSMRFSVPNSGDEETDSRSSLSGDTGSSCRVIDLNGARTSVHELKENNCVTMIIVPDRIRFYPNKFELVWVVHEIRINSYISQTTEYLFDDDEDNGKGAADEIDYAMTIAIDD